MSLPEVQRGQCVVLAPSNPMGNARLFVVRVFHESDHDLLSHHRGIFRWWSGSAWPRLDDDELTAMLYVYFEDAEYVHVGQNGRELRPFRPNTSKVREVREALRALVQQPSDVEMPYWTDNCQLPPVDILPMANGLLYVPSRTLFSPRPTFRNAYSVPYEYDESAGRPTRWLQFLDELWGSDPEPKALLQEWMGLVLVPDTSQQKMLLGVGPPRSGKGTIVRVIRGMVGKHNVAAPTLAGLATNFGLQPLIDRPVANISDARLSGRKDGSVVVERLLSISGEDPVTIDIKYKPQHTAVLPTRIAIWTNELPRLSDASGALASRFLALKMEESFLGREDHGLADKLLAELPAILLWSLDGLDRLRERGHLLQPTSGNEVVNELVTLSSPVKAFVHERCVLDTTASIAIDDLYRQWQSWCQSGGRHPTAKTTFSRDLQAAFPDLRVIRPAADDGTRPRHYAGITMAG